MTLATNSLGRIFFVFVVFAFTPIAKAVTEVAKINQTVITLEQVEAKYKESLKYFQVKPPSKKAILDEFIRREIGVQEAKKLGLDKDPEVLDKTQTVLFQTLIERKLGKDFEKIAVTDAEIKEFYAKNPEIRTSHVFISVSPNATPEEIRKSQVRIQQIYDEQIRPGKASFAEVAQRFSEGIAAPMGGDIDYQSREKLDPNYYQTALGLKTPGRISGVIRSQFGFHIIKLTAIRPWEDVDKLAVKRQVFEKKRTELYDRYIAQLRSQAKVSISSAAPRE